MRKLSTYMHFVHTVARSYLDRFNDAYFLYDLLLHSKNIGAEADLTIRISLPEFFPDHVDKIALLRDKWIYIDHLAENEPDKLDAIQSQKHEAQKIEIELAPHVRELNFKQHMANMSTQKVLEKLPLGHALLEYGWFHYTKSAVDTRTDIESSGRYYVYLLRDDKITLHYLDETEEPIHKNLEKSRQVITEITAIEDAKNALSKLYKLLIAPFADSLQGIEHLYIAPDGELYKLPFELLLDENDKPLSDKYSISYLSSGRDIARPEKWNIPIHTYQSAAILAAPSYRLPDDIIPERSENESDETDRDITSKQQSRYVNELKQFYPLPYTEKEAYSLEKVFIGTKVIKYGIDARKNSLNDREASTSNIIHIATHGFALEKQELPDDQLDMLLGNKLKYCRAEDPLVRCGLAFAGVNNWLESDKKSLLPEYGDGILNAKEVLSLDLRQTDLLVLSACQTGLGNVKNGEGIQGLRRAFELAGVNTLICTLWKVSDIASAVLMAEFYRNLLEDSLNKLQSLIKAKEYVRTMTALDVIDFCRENGMQKDAEALEENYKDKLDEKLCEHPYFWAGYILQGETRRPKGGEKST